MPYLITLGRVSAEKLNKTQLEKPREKGGSKRAAWNAERG